MECLCIFNLVLNLSILIEYLEKIKNLSAIDSSIYKHFLVDYNGEL